jgi:hypothetical protein
VHQSQMALLDSLQHGKTLRRVSFCDGHDQIEIGFDQTLTSKFPRVVLIPNVLQQVGLFAFLQHRDLAQFAKIHSYGSVVIHAQGLIRLVQWLGRLDSN